MKIKILLILSLVFLIAGSGCSGLIAVAAAGKYVYENFHQSKVTIESADRSPEQVVEIFYADYLGTIGDRAAGYFHNPIANKIYRDRTDLSPDFIMKVDELIESFDKAGYDPFLCSQDIPERINVEETIIDENSAIVSVTSSYSGHEFIVELIMSERTWKINEITCDINIKVHIEQ